MQELTIITRQEPGFASFENYEEIKAYLERYLQTYKGLVYSEDNLKGAKADKAQLTKLKKALDDRRKEIKNAYMAPYMEIEARIKELTAMVDEPLADIAAFVKGMEAEEKEQKRRQIKAYFDSVSGGLGDMADKVFASPGFYDAKWENKSTPVKTWQDNIRAKIAQAAADLSVIQAGGGAQVAVLTVKYLETMSLEDTIAFQTALREASEIGEISAVPSENRVIGYKVLKVMGTQEQMSQILDQMAILGMEVDELEDGMPKELEELTVPDFDSFVCFDIETSGTYGAANGDAPAEITEIGAVKVVNGKIVDRQDWLCNPGRKIVPRIARLTHITDEMVAQKPPVDEVIRAFADYVGDMPIVGHNIKSSDLHYIGAAAKRAGVALRSPFFDTYRYAQKFRAAKGWDNVKLEYLSQSFGIAQPDAHRAWCDAEANVGVYFKLKEIDG